jgi:hypothetical protein
MPQSPLYSNATHPSCGVELFAANAANVDDFEKFAQRRTGIAAPGLEPTRVQVSVSQAKAKQ